MTTCSAVDNVRVRCRVQAAPHNPLENLVGARFRERHDAAFDLFHGIAVDVEEGDIQAAVGECQAQGQPHVAAAPDNDYIPLKTHTCPLLGRER